MRIKFRFQLSEPISLSDRWPIKSDGAIYSFVGPLDKVTEIAATLLSQPIEFAPTTKQDGGLTNIRLGHRSLLPRVQERLDYVQCAFGMLVPIEIDLEHYEAEFEPENVDEESQIPIRSWGESRKRYRNRLTFDLAAKGLLVDSWPQTERESAQFFGGAGLR